MSELVAANDLDASAFGHVCEHEGESRLRGGQCIRCDRQFFPLKSVCPYCAAEAVEAVALAARGRLYAYTTVHVSSTHKTPYLIGYVDLSHNVRVLTRLLAIEAQLSLDMTMKLLIGSDGAWTFSPCESLL